MANGKGKAKEEEIVEVEEVDLKEIDNGFLKKLSQHDGSDKHIKLPDNEWMTLALGNWRFEQNPNFKDEALVFDVYNVDGEMTKQYQDKEGMLRWPDLSTTSKRLISALSPHLRKAIKAGKTSVAVRIKRYVGKDPFDTKYEVEAING